MKSQSKILIVDGIPQRFAGIVSNEHQQVELVTTQQEALRLIEQHEYHIVILYRKGDPVQEKNFVKYIKKEIPTIFIIIVGIQKSETIDEMLTSGLCDFFVISMNRRDMNDEIQSIIDKFQYVHKNEDFSSTLSRQNQELFRRIDVLSSLESSNLPKGDVLSALVNASQTINVSVDIDTILKSVVEIAATTLQCKTAALLCLDGDKTHLAIRAAVGLTEQLIQNTRIPIGEGVAGWVVAKGQAVLIKDIEKDTRFAKYHKDEYASKSLICVPLIVKGEVTGALHVSMKNNGAPFHDTDLQMVTLLAHQAAMAMDNFRLYSEIQEHYFNTVKALTMTIEAKDPYTQGHSSRVTGYAIALARHLKLSTTDLGLLERACHLHDIGKIAVSESILLKKGKLTDAEFAMIKKHPVAGENILKPISFLQKERRIIRHHHERYDGKGYPDGLTRKNIPLLSRILAIADSYDAMTSERSYRQGLKHDEAIKEIIKCASLQFDPDLVGPFTEVIEKIRSDNKSSGYMGHYTKISRKPVNQVKVIAITSGKGGVGKTNFVVNVGLALCKMGKRVLVIDADLGLANVDVLFGLTPQYNIHHVLSEKKDILDIMIEGPLGLNIIPASSGIKELTLLDTLQQKIFMENFDKVRKNIDYVLIDTEAGIGKNAVNFCLVADETYVITTPEPTAIMDAYAMIKTLIGHNVEVEIKLIMNMVKNQKEAIEVSEKMITITKQFLNRGIKMGGYILKDETVSKSVKAQSPFFLEHPYARVTENIQTIACRIAGEKSQRPSRRSYEANMKRALYRLSAFVQ